MNIFKLAAQIFLIYILYKFIVGIVIPIYRSTKNVKKQFGEMQSKMEEMKRQQTTAQPQAQAKPQEVVKEKDYIEFEELP